MAFGVNLIPSNLRSGSTLSGSIGSAGSSYPAPQQSVDLSFLNDPNNPYYTNAYSPYYQGPSGTDAGSGDTGGDFLSFLNLAQQQLDQRPVLDSSPEWLAYINALGLQKNQFAADVARQEAIARQAQEFKINALKPQYEEQRRGLTSRAEGRGINSTSGVFQRQLAVNRANQGTQESAIRQATAAQLSNLESQLAQKNLDLEAQRQQQRASMLSAGYQPFDWTKFQQAANSGYFG